MSRWNAEDDLYRQDMRPVRYDGGKANANAAAQRISARVAAAADAHVAAFGPRAALADIPPTLRVDDVRAAVSRAAGLDEYVPYSRRWMAVGAVVDGWRTWPSAATLRAVRDACEGRDIPAEAAARAVVRLEKLDAAASAAKGVR